MQYVVERAPSDPVLPSPWDGPFWSPANVIHVTNFHPASASTHPVTDAKVLYGDRHLYLHFRVHDRDVRAAHTDYQSPVCQDSCAEFFVQPHGSKGYFNFEINPLGTLLLFYVTDPTRIGPALKEYQPVPPDLASRIQIHGSLTKATGDSILSGPLDWSLQYAIPFSLFDPFVGRPTRPSPGDRWRANFYKCGDKTPYPHWASWAPIGEALNFHQPDRFGEIVFGG